MHSALRELQTIPYIEIHSALRELLTIPYIEMHSALMRHGSLYHKIITVQVEALEFRCVFIQSMT